MPSIETHVTIISQPSEPLKVRFDLINSGYENVRILPRYTPLEGLKCDCLIVKFEGKKVRYDGFFFKRELEDESSYLPLPAGETLSNTVDVSEAYDTTRPGHYEVTFPRNRLVVLPDTELVKMSFTMAKFKPITSIKTIGALQLRKLASPQLTAGAEMRMRFISLEKALTLQEPVFLNGTARQREIILKAHHRGLEYAEKSAENVLEDARYKEWFGEYNYTRPPRVKLVFEKIAKRRAQFHYKVGGKYCDDKTYAYTTIGGNQIWICAKFWEAPDDGIESRAGTIVHEHSHASGGTNDHDYMRMACRDLAKGHPLKAIRNADNYEFFAEFLMLRH